MSQICFCRDVLNADLLTKMRRLALFGLLVRRWEDRVPSEEAEVASPDDVDLLSGVHFIDINWLKNQQILVGIA
jgi:hypothetical protein